MVFMSEYVVDFVASRFPAMVSTAYPQSDLVTPAMLVVIQVGQSCIIRPPEERRESV